MTTLIKTIIAIFATVVATGSAASQTVAEPDTADVGGDVDGRVTETVVEETFSLEEIKSHASQPLDLGLTTEVIIPDTVSLLSATDSPEMRKSGAKGIVPSIYSLPYSLTGRAHDWRRLWINTSVLTGAFVGTLFVLEMLPEDATTWNRAALQKVPLFERWKDHVLVKGPEWDHDKFYFNYLLHPYAGAVYFMSARSVGFNFWQSLLYSSLISNVGWEFGVEAFMERPSYQDLVITPVVGSIIGEGFYRLKRHLVANDYRIAGSPVLGNIVAFLIDPVNEVVGIFDHNPARAEARRLKAERGQQMSFVPVVTPGYYGFTFSATF